MTNSIDTYSAALYQALKTLSIKEDDASCEAYNILSDLYEDIKTGNKAVKQNSDDVMTQMQILGKELNELGNKLPETTDFTLDSQYGVRFF